MMRAAKAFQLQTGMPRSCRVAERTLSGLPALINTSPGGREELDPGPGGMYQRHVANAACEGVRLESHGRHRRWILGRVPAISAQYNGQSHPSGTLGCFG